MFTLLLVLVAHRLIHAILQLSANNRRRKDLYTLPQPDLEILERLGYKQKLAEVDNAILANAEFLNKIVANPEIFGHDVSALEEADQDSPSADQGSHFHGVSTPVDGL